MFIGLLEEKFDFFLKVHKTGKMSQSQLGFEAGITREFVNKVESGNYNISVKKLEKLAEILGVEIGTLFTHNKSES